MHLSQQNVCRSVEMILQRDIQLNQTIQVRTDEQRASLQPYVELMGRYPTLRDREEFLDLYSRYRALRGTPEGSQLRDRLIGGNISLALIMAQHLRGRGMLVEDLVQVGLMEIHVKLLDSFDPSLGNRFATYALWGLFNAMSRALEGESSNVFRLRHHVMWAIRTLRRLRTRFRDEQGVWPTEEELWGLVEARKEELASAEMKKNPNRKTHPRPLPWFTKRLFQHVARGHGFQGVFLSDPISPGVEMTWEEKLESSHVSPPISVESLTMVRDAFNHVQTLLRVIDSLKPSRAEILRRVYGLGTPLVSPAELGRWKQVSRQAIQQKGRSGVGALARRVKLPAQKVEHLLRLAGECGWADTHTFKNQLPDMVAPQLRDPSEVFTHVYDALREHSKEVPDVPAPFVPHPERVLMVRFNCSNDTARGLILRFERVGWLMKHPTRDGHLLVRNTA